MCSKHLVAVVLVLGSIAGISGCHCGLPGYPVLAIPYTDDSGYTLSGILDFSGELLRPVGETDPWVLDWNFTFPTGGYTVEDVDVSIMESFPEQVTVRFLVDTPAPGEIVTQAIVEVAGSQEIDVDADATFDIRIVEACNLALTP